MGDAAKISRRIPFTCAQNAILSCLIVRDCKAMGDAVRISPRVASTCVQTAFLSVLIIHIIPRRQIYVADDNRLLVPSVSCLATSTAISGIDCLGLTIISMLKSCKATSASTFLTCTKFKMGSMLLMISGMVMSARANQSSKKPPSSFWRLIFNSRCSCHGRHPFSAA